METNLTAGAARIDLTPTRRLAGSRTDAHFGPGGSPLQGTALAFECGDRAAALVAVDLCVLDPSTVRYIRQRVSEVTPIPAANLMLAASHTHSGPHVTRWLTPELDCEYVTWFADRLVEVTARAWETRRPALVGTGKGIVGLAVNRWVETPQGARWGVAWDCPTDNTLTVLRVDAPDGGPFAAMANFAAHASVMSFGKAQRYSADYPGFVRSYLEAANPGLTGLFTNGASGDLKIAFVDDNGEQFRYGDIGDARHFGELIGREARAVMSRITAEPVRELRVASEWCELPMGDPPTEEELLRDIAAPEFPQCGTAWAREMLALLRAGRFPATFPAQVQVLRLGQAAVLVALPGEPFVEIGLRLRRELAPAYPALCLVGYANGYAGYLPSRRSVILDGERPRYNWHKFVGMSALYTEQAEDILVAAVHTALAATTDGTPTPKTPGRAGRALTTP